MTKGKPSDKGDKIKKATVPVLKQRCVFLNLDGTVKTSQKCCVIFGARPVSQSMAKWIPEGAFIIGADRGWQQAVALGFTPDLVLGDFDSAPPPSSAAELLHLPAEKDDTDMFYAAKEALARGFTSILILGALGGRIDHSFANLQTLLYLAQHGANASIADENSEIYCIAPGELHLPARNHTYLSVFAVGGNARGVFLEGVKYPLKNATLTTDYPLGTSNEICAPVGKVRCEKGYLYVMVVDKEQSSFGNGVV